MDLSNERHLRALTALVNELNSTVNTLGETACASKPFVITDEMLAQIQEAEDRKVVANRQVLTDDQIDATKYALKSDAAPQKTKKVKLQKAEILKSELPEAETPVNTSVGPEAGLSENPNETIVTTEDTAEKPEVSLVTIRTRMAPLVKTAAKEKLQKKMRELGAEKISEMSEQHYGEFMKYIQELENEQ